MLERMKEKVDQKETLSEAYADIAHESRSLDEELNDTLSSEELDASSALAALKAKMNPDTK